MSVVTGAEKKVNVAETKPAKDEPKQAEKQTTKKKGKAE